MHCHDTKKEIELYVLDGLDGETRAHVRRHLFHCPVCRDLERQCRTLLCELKQPTSSGDTRALVERICTASHNQLQAARRPFLLSRIAWAVRSIAALVVIALVVWGFRPQGGVSTEPRTTVWQKTNALGTGDDIAVNDGRVYYLQQQATGALVMAAQAASGTTLWQSDLPSVGHLVTDEHRVFCVAKSSPSHMELAALDRITGQVLWALSPPRAVSPMTKLRKATPLSKDCMAWVVGDRIYAVHTVTGALRWQRHFHRERQLSRAVVVRDQVFVAGQRHLYCLNQRNGQVHWRRDGDGTTAVETPVLAAGRRHLFVATAAPGGKSRISCIHARTRVCQWQKTVPRTTFVCADDDHVYLRSQGVTALDQKTGQRSWQVPGQGCGPITMCDDVVCFVDQTQEGHLVAIKRTDGSLAWHIPGLHSGQAFIMAGRRGFLKTRDSTVLAFAF
jgi:outer membrane protein assembly factor BamB